MTDKVVTVEITVADDGDHDEHELLDWLNWQLDDNRPMLDSFDPSAIRATRVRRVSDAERDLADPIGES